MPAMTVSTSGSARRRSRRPVDNPAQPGLFAGCVDGEVIGSVSSAPTDGPTTAPNPSWSAPSPLHGLDGHGLVAVGPGFGDPVLAMPLLRFGGMTFPPMNPLPVRASKIDKAYLREDTLPRVRLNAWLERSARGRLVVIVADAGFGKTTLLTDWSKRTQRHVAWYRLERDDRDWLTFIRHLVAGGREVEAGFAPDTYRLLCQMGPGGPTKDEVLTSLAKEMAAFGESSAHGFSVLLDDFHNVECSEETDPIIEALLEATGPGFSLVITARSTPELPPVKLRGTENNQLAEDDLRFTASETEALFNEAYNIALERDVAVELAARTQGWAALLSLVRTRLEEQPEPDPRALVTQLSATKGDLYDYLAEEVLSELPPELADLVTHLSILEVVSIEGAKVVVGDPGDLETRLREAEATGILRRVLGSDRWAFAPLVREFLGARLEHLRGRREVRELHLRIAKHFDGEDWLISASHYVQGGRPQEALRLVSDSIEDVLGSGAYRTAIDLLSDADDEGGAGEIIRARALLQLGSSRESLEAAERAVRAVEHSAGPQLATALRNAASVAIGVHAYGAAAGYSSRAATAALTASGRRLAETQLDLIAIGGWGNLPALALRLEQLLVSHKRSHKPHYEAISALNLALVYLWLDRASEALSLCVRADELLQQSSRGYERVSVILARAHAEAMLGRWREASVLMNVALAVDHPEGNAEAVLEAAWVNAWFGPDGSAEGILDRVQIERLHDEWQPHWHVVRLWIARDPTDIERLLPLLSGEPTVSLEAGSAFRWQLARARALVKIGRTEQAREALESARSVAIAQGSPIERRLVEMLSALLRGPSAASHLIAAWSADDDPMLGVFAGEVGEVLGELAPDAIDALGRAVRNCPDRWRPVLRVQLGSASVVTARRAAALLETVGETEDIPRLKDASRRLKRQSENWGGALIRRLAPRVWVEDLGLTSVTVGELLTEGQTMRRKALALLLFLLSQPRGAANPDQLLEALWPEQDPEPALNSLHQAIYVLRRVFEPNYHAGVSPEYLHFESDMVWLDPELVDSRSWQCQRLLASREWPTERINELVSTYTGRFAIDFMYEEWASSQRDRLHAQFLGTVEQAVSGRIGPGDVRWRLWAGQRALEIDPDADSIEAQVIGLYRVVEANSAAREQYAHYASAMREQLGVEPPPFEDL
jgi:DNA-binding SARP family transcriptional activator